VSRIVEVNSRDGERIRHTVDGPQEQTNWEQIYDPETQIEHSNSLDQFGKVTRNGTVAHGKLTSFWPARRLKSAVWR